MNGSTQDRRRDVREEAWLQEQRRGRLRRLLRWALLGGAGAVALIGVGYWIVSNATQPEPGIDVSIQGFEHIEPGQPHPPYNTIPPTSGWHYSAPAPWAIYQEPIPDEVQIHNLEHGGIMVQYNCPKQEASCQELVKSLEKTVRRHSSKVVLAPYPKMESLIALTAWGKIRTLDAFDEKTINRFIEFYKNRGPEQVPD